MVFVFSVFVVVRCSLFVVGCCCSLMLVGCRCLWLVAYSCLLIACFCLLYCCSLLVASCCLFACLLRVALNFVCCFVIVVGSLSFVV